MPKRIVIADDSPHIIEPVRIYLDRAGYVVLVATSAEEALAHILSGPIDLLITDVDMGSGMDGLELVAELRNRGFDLPVIVMSTMDAQRIREHLSGLGNAQFVPKPFWPKTMFAAVLQSMTTETEPEAADAAPQKP